VTKKGAAARAAVTVLVALGWLLRPTNDATTLRAGTPRQTVTLTIDNTRVGDTGITIELADHDGRPLSEAFIRVQPVMPLMGHATPEKVATAVQGGRYTVAGIHFMTTGPWQIHLRVTLADGTHDELVMPFHVTG
jgi:hypothetical protein